MKKYISLLVAVCGALFLFSGCSEKKPELHLYNWVDYINPESIQRFEEKYNCKVVVDYFDSNEAMYAKLKAGATGFDVVFPSSYQSAIMNQEGMLLPMDASKMPNLQLVDKEFLKYTAVDKTMSYSVPYMTGATVLAYRESKVPDFVPSWNVFLREDLKGRMTLLNDMRETIGAALITLGYSVNTTDEAQLAQAEEIVRGWKANIAKFENEGYKAGIGSGEFVVVHGYAGDLMQVIEENEDYDIKLALPKEGTTVWVDDMVILKNAPDVELAYAFVNFMHDPEIAKLNMEFNYIQCPNVEGYKIVDPEIKEDPILFLPDEMRSKAEQILDLGEDLPKYTKVWDRIKSTN